MKQIFISLGLAALFMLVGCEAEEKIGGGDTGYVEPGATVLSFKLGNGGSPKGYAAVGDPDDTGLATEEEKEIRSVAFFVQTSSNFAYYLSTEEQMSQNGLLEPLKEVVTGEKGAYECQVKIKTNQFGTSTVVVLANFNENGMLNKVKAVRNMDELKNLISEAVDVNPVTPLLMYAINEQVELKEGQHVPVTFKMDRLVARIDIENKAFNGDADKGFVLESARLLNAKTASYFAANHGKSKDIAVADFAMRKPEVATPLLIDTLYTYEASNAEADGKATWIEITGKYKGVSVKQQIPFIKPADRSIVPIVRNTRYKVEIKQAPDSTQLIYGIKVKDWDSADTIYVEPNATKPEFVFEANAATALTAAGGTWDAVTKTIDISDLNAPVDFSFVVKGLMDSKLKEVVSEKLPYIKRAFMNLELGELVGYAAQTPVLTRSCKLTLTPPTDSDPLPSIGYLIFGNALNPAICDTVTVKYYKSNEKPVFFGFIDTDLKSKGGTWDEATKTIDVSSLTAEATFSFGSLGNVAPGVTLTAAPAPYSQRGTWVTYTSEDIKTYGVASGTNHKLTINKLTPNQDVYPACYYMVFKNPQDASKMDTVTVKYYSNPTSLQVTNYNTTNLQSATWTLGTKTINITNMTANGSFSFSVAGTTDTKVAISYEYDMKSDWMKDKVTYQDIKTYGAIERVYTISLPKSPAPQSPKKAVITISKTDDSAEVAFIVEYAPKYPGTNLAAVLYKGKYWAPVNQGGTVDLSTATITVDAGSSVLGYLYQWGRNVPLDYKTMTNQVVTSKANLPNYVDACSNTGIYQNKFIQISSNIADAWFKDNASGGGYGFSTALSGMEWPRENQPCPAGWRVPNEGELRLIEADKPVIVDGKWKAPSNSQFILIASGHHFYSDGQSYDIPWSGYLWSSTLLESGKSPRLGFGRNASDCAMNNYGLADGMPVRCIQE